MPALTNDQLNHLNGFRIQLDTENSRHQAEVSRLMSLQKAVIDENCEVPAQQPLPTLESLVTACKFTNNPDLEGLTIRSSGERSSLVKAIPEPNGITSDNADKKYRKSSPDEAEALKWFAENKEDSYFVVLGVRRKISGIVYVLVLYRRGSDRKLTWGKRDGDWSGNCKFLSVAQ